jgi:acetolactate synthase I/II/III large subunit
MARHTAADVLCRALTANGVEHLFGVPGTQSIDLWEGLRRTGAPQALVATNELAAGFMANGYARASGKAGVVATIPGPGFTYALTPLAEARLDSVPVVHIVGAAARREDGAPALQAIPQAEIAGPLVKGVIEVGSHERIDAAVGEALGLASRGEPGPVLLEIQESVLGMPSGRTRAPAQAAPSPPARPVELDGAAERIAAASRPLLFCGQGAQGSAGLVGELAERLSAPVLTTTSGRGVVSEASPWSLVFDSPGASTSSLNELLAEADLVVALGIKFSHNATFGFALRIAPEKLIRIDTSEARSPAYPASLEIEADVGDAARWLMESLSGGSASLWQVEEVAGRRRRLAAAAAVAEPRLAGRPAAAFFADLRRAMPEAAVLTTDSGFHQYMVRRHQQVLAPRTLLVPANFQSMGFGLPAAIGAAVSTGRVAAAIVGDGGFNIGGLELATAVHAGIPLVVIVFVDGAFGLIRLQQLRRTGRTSGVDLPRTDLSAIAGAVGADYEKIDAGDALPALTSAFGSGGVTILEVAVEHTGELDRARRRGLATSTAQSVLGPRISKRLMDSARRRRN